LNLGEIRWITEFRITRVYVGLGAGIHRASCHSGASISGKGDFACAWIEVAKAGFPVGVEPAETRTVARSGGGERIVYLRRELKVDPAVISNFL
jgi:hypothetical protein